MSPSVFNATWPMARAGPNRFCRGSHTPVGYRKFFGGPRRYVVCSRFSAFHTVFRSSELFCIVNAQSARSLIDKFLTLDPNKRISAKDALDSDYFWEDPLPCKPSELPKYEPSHEFQTRKRRQVRESSTPTHFSHVLSRVALLFARDFHVQVLI
jgi:serine/threonine protein kinase